MRRRLALGRELRAAIGPQAVLLRPSTERAGDWQPHAPDDDPHDGRGVPPAQARDEPPQPRNEDAAQSRAGAHQPQGYAPLLHEPVVRDHQGRHTDAYGHTQRDHQHKDQIETQKGIDPAQEEVPHPGDPNTDDHHAPGPEPVG